VDAEAARSALEAVTRFPPVSVARFALLALAGAAALVVGTIITPIADRLRLPFAGLAFASVVSLIPGVFLFRMAGGMVDLITHRHLRSSSSRWSPTERRPS
jgi:uncharacterized membrane protein YjjB (DUF3815 family)